MNVQERNTQDYSDWEQMPQFQDQPDHHSDWDLLQGIASFGFERPSEIQQKTIVPLYQGYNVIGQAQSGRGKTGAFVIGSLSRLDKDVHSVQLVILANTHELARQIESVVSGIGCQVLKDSDVELCIGQQISMEQNIRHIRAGCKVLVGTPGRVKHVLRHQIHSKSMVNPFHVKTLILDEADRLLMGEFRQPIIDIIDILDHPDREVPLQLGIFSATFSQDSLNISRILCVPDKGERGEAWRDSPTAPLEVLIPVEELTLDGIQQYYYEFDCGQDDVFRQKADFISLMNSVQMIPMCIIYVNSTRSAEHLKHLLDEENMISQCIYGGMPPSQRQSVIQQFRDCEIRILITTDLLSRGFDVQQVELVINFDLPYVQDKMTAEVNKEKMAEYLHRIGRGGRFGRKGMAISLIGSPAERDRKEDIEKYYDTKMHLLPEDITGLY